MTAGRKSQLHLVPAHHETAKRSWQSGSAAAAAAAAGSGWLELSAQDERAHPGVSAARCGTVNVNRRGRCYRRGGCEAARGVLLHVI